MGWKTNETTKLEVTLEAALVPMSNCEAEGPKWKSNEKVKVKPRAKMGSMMQEETMKFYPQIWHGSTSAPGHLTLIESMRRH
jgi:hypothetical protein